MVPNMKYYIIVLFFVQGLCARKNFGYKKHLEFLINETDTRIADADEQWFTQILDHENPASGNWQQRYYVTEKFYSPSNGGPAFLFIGGEAELTSYWIHNGAWIEYAKTYGALCFAVEHRYYGHSYPTRDTSTENLRYLSSRQALADLAQFITSMNQQYRLPPNTKWIVFGGSYAGSLAAWMRSKYPNLVHGAVASSAPILAKVDFSDYLKVVAESLRSHSSECLSAVSKAFARIDSLLQSGPTGQRVLDSKLQLCNPIERYISNPLYITEFYDELAGFFSEIVQRNYKDYPMNIAQACDIMTNGRFEDLIDRLNVLVTKILSNQKCLSYDYQGSIEERKNTQWRNVYARQWTYQTCTEFGYYQTSTEDRSPFGHNIPIEYYIQQCTDIFGSEFDSARISAAVQNTNSYYGGLDIKATNVVFVQGSLDPWKALGLTQTRNQENPVIYIKGTTHCADMVGLPGTADARRQISGHIREMLTN